MHAGAGVGEVTAADPEVAVVVDLVRLLERVNVAVGSASEATPKGHARCPTTSPVATATPNPSSRDLPTIELRPQELSELRDVVSQPGL